MNPEIYIHNTANIDASSSIGAGTKIWINCQVRENASIGENCNLSKDVYIDCNVQVGDNCKIQNGVSIYDGVTVESKVFIGPHVTFTNDKVPRAFNDSWTITKTLVKEGASIGANSTIICGITLGEYSMVAAGSVVTKDVPPYSLVVGNPARVVAKIGKDGNKIEE